MTGGGWLCLTAPLAGTILILLGGTRTSRPVAGWISTSSVAVAFAGAIWAFFSLRSQSGHTGTTSTAWTWLQAGKFSASLSILVDPLSSMMMLIVSGVGALIVLYSIGYMDRDDEERRYFAYMSLFVFSMLLLVEGGNLLMLLIGWGLVGLSSYLLIGFWHDRPSAVKAAKKAFVMNAVGDATMALAFFVLIAHSNSLDFATAPPSRPSAIRFATVPPCGAAANAPLKSRCPVCSSSRKSASAKVASPNAFITNAFLAAAIALGRSWLKPISR